MYCKIKRRFLITRICLIEANTVSYTHHLRRLVYALFDFLFLVFLPPERFTRPSISKIFMFLTNVEYSSKSSQLLRSEGVW